MVDELLSDEEINELITCPKRVTNRPNITVDFRHRKKNYSLVSEKYPDYQFSLFYRQNVEEEDDYSVGLRVILPNGEDHTLVRFNGSSHCHPNRIEGNVIEWKAHIHRATSRYMERGKADGFAEATEAYQTVDEALVYACGYCNIMGMETPGISLRLV